MGYPSSSRVRRDAIITLCPDCGKPTIPAHERLHLFLPRNWAKIGITWPVEITFLQAVTTAVALEFGLGSSLFAVALCFTVITMYDAAGVRRHAGEAK